ncbi:MAG: hypothetical protein FJX60_16430 [Alphaproteobacteria bacterium]|nr:hypothetical protein [Alphaproteobacteria bacterium]
MLGDRGNLHSELLPPESRKQQRSHLGQVAGQDGKIFLCRRDAVEPVNQACHTVEGCAAIAWLSEQCRDQKAVMSEARIVRRSVGRGVEQRDRLLAATGGEAFLYGG